MVEKQAPSNSKFEQCNPYRKLENKAKFLFVLHFHLSFPHSFFFLSDSFGLKSQSFQLSTTYLFQYAQCVQMSPFPGEQWHVTFGKGHPTKHSLQCTWVSCLLPYSASCQFPASPCANVKWAALGSPRAFLDSTSLSVCKGDGNGEPTMTCGGGFLLDLLAQNQCRQLSFNETEL